MSKIDIHNYEAFYLDYLEGNLSEEDTAQLMLFLDSNPDIKAELNEFEWLELDTPKVEFDKSSLHQTINEANVEDYIIASLEKVIDPDDELELNEYLNRSDKAMAMANRYKRTILPQREIHYPEKNKLKKRGVPIYYLAPLIGAAAAVFLFFIINPIINEPITLQQQAQIIDSTNIPELKSDSIPNENLLASVDTSVLETAIDTKKIIETPNEVTAIVSKPVDNLQPAITERSESNKEEIEPMVIEIERMKQLDPVFVCQFENNWRENNTVLAVMKNQNQEELLIAEVPAESQTESPSKRGINLFKILELGVKGFNALNERDYAVVPSYNVSGQLQSVTLITDERTFTTPAI